MLGLARTIHRQDDGSHPDFIWLPLRMSVEDPTYAPGPLDVVWRVRFEELNAPRLTSTPSTGSDTDTPCAATSDSAETLPAAWTCSTPERCTAEEAESPLPCLKSSGFSILSKWLISKDSFRGIVRTVFDRWQSGPGKLNEADQKDQEATWGYLESHLANKTYEAAREGCYGLIWESLGRES